jgi:hypothetical protein
MEILKAKYILKFTVICFSMFMISMAINPVLSSNGVYNGSTTIQSGGTQEIQWNKTYGGTDGEGASSLVQTDDGGFAIAGATESYGAGDYDFWLVKTGANGTTQWQQTYGGIGTDRASSIIQTTDGGFAITGYTYSYGAGVDDFWLVKTSADGTMQWQQTYGGTGTERAFSLIQTIDGGFVLVGFTSSYGVGDWDFWLVKTNVDGNMLWHQTYGGTSGEGAFSLIQTADSGFAIAGATISYGVGDYDFWLVKTTADGTSQWNKTYGGTGNDQASSLVQTDDGGFALAGTTSSYGAGSGDFWLVKTTADGTSQWNKTYGGISSDQASSLVQTDDGGFAIAGYTYSYGAGVDDFWFVKTVENGTAQWNKTYGGTSTDWASSLIQTTDGGYALAGRTASFGAGADDFWLVKTATITSTTNATGLEVFPLLVAVATMTLWYCGKKSFLSPRKKDS